jgi:asparagine synthase (glutamine-hydrolysing)
MEELGNTHGATSFFSGNGGDTIFSYLKNASPAVDAFKERGLGAGIIAIKNLSTLYRCTIWKAGRLTLRKLIRGPRAPWPIDHSLLNPLKAISTLPQHPWFDLKREALPGDREKINSLIITQSYRNTLLSKNEGGFERIPLLSQPVMEACLKVPTWMWIWKGQNRFAARAAFADLLPERILNRQDKGAYGNHIAAIYRKNKLQMRDFLLTGHLHAQKFLDGDALAQTFEKDRPSDDRASFARIFDFCMIENWLRQQASN